MGWEHMVKKYETAEERSMEFLRDVAQTFGVKFISISTRKVIFRHRHLVFELTGSGIRIMPLLAKAGLNLVICVVDEQNLPIGDFYASMLGLIISKPQELDVVNFGIKLGEIVNRHPDLKWKGAMEGRFAIGIYTPFNPVSNAQFDRLLEYMRTAGYPDSILEEIRDALVACFGNTMGFFE